MYSAGKGKIVVPNYHLETRMNWPGFDLQGPARWIAGAAALAGVAGIVMSQTVLWPKYEVLYSGGVTAVHCANVEGRQGCTFIYEFSVGNTGRNEQESVRIEWPLDMQRWYVGTQIADIVASARKTPEPQIRPAFESGKTVYAINRLMPNTVVEFKVRCIVCTPAQLHAMQQAHVTVEARGVVSEADPRVSALRHGVMNLLRLVGLFR